MASNYASFTKEQLAAQKEQLEQKYNDFKNQNLNLNMARGKPSLDQLNLSVGMMDIMSSTSDFLSMGGEDCRNYGILEGIPEMKLFFAELLGVSEQDVIVGGNSSLSMMFDIVACAMYSGFPGCKPWSQQGEVKFLCPVPGYDRHFTICEYFGITMIPIPMLSTGPDMDLVERYVSEDASVKGIWCVPKYSNPQGITYSEETVRRFAALQPAAKDFKILWDNAYCVHELTDTPEVLFNIFDACKENGTEDLVIEFCSTSKITFPGSGVAALTGSENSLRNFRRSLAVQSIGPDKINQIRHLRYFGSVEGMKKHMEKHRAVLAPRFEVVLNALNTELAPLDIAHWITPKGGYFVSVDVMPGCAKRVVQLCKEGGVILTNAGATFPYRKDPKDSNIRIAPSFPPLEELKQAITLFCICVKLATVEKLLQD